MYRKFVVAAAAIGVAAILPVTSFAQNYQQLRQASIDIYNTCLTAEGDSASYAGCACLAGFIGGVLTEREYDIAARLVRIGSLVENGASEAMIAEEVNAFARAGYTADDADAVTMKLEQETARGNAICSPYENTTTS